MDREKGNKEKMRKCREWIFLHFLFIFSFSLHFLAARLAGCYNFCNPGSIYLFILSIRTLRSEFATSKGSLLRVVFQFQLAPCSQLGALLAEAELTKLLCGEYNHMRTGGGLFCNPVIYRPNRCQTLSNCTKSDQPNLFYQIFFHFLFLIAFPQLGQASNVGHREPEDLKIDLHLKWHILIVRANLNNNKMWLLTVSR